MLAGKKKFPAVNINNNERVADKKKKKTKTTSYRLITMILPAGRWWRSCKIIYAYGKNRTSPAAVVAKN